MNCGLKRIAAFAANKYAVLFALLLLAQNSLSEIKIEGIKSPLTENVLAHLSLSREKCDAPNWRLQQRRREVDAQIYKALQAFGYYQPEITQHFSQGEKCWLLELNITPGPAVTFREVDIQILDKHEDMPTALQELTDAPRVQKNIQLNHQLYDNFKSALMDAARALGYWQSRFAKSSLAVYPGELAADVELHFILGPRYIFGDYSFPEIYLNKNLLQRLVEPVEQQYYSSELVQESYSRLQGSDYFQQVLITPQVSADESDLTVPMHVDLSMNSRHSFGAGVGYSTDQGQRIRGDYKNRYVNPAGHTFGAFALWSMRLKQLSGTYRMPRRDAADEWLELGAGYEEETTDSYSNVIKSTSARMISALPHDWVMNIGINIFNERYIIGDDSNIDNKTMIVPGIGYTWSSADETTRQTKGLRFEAGVTASHNEWKSDVDYLQGYTRSKFILSPTPRLRLLSRFEIAGTLMNDITELPPSVRFFTGGDNSIRGYGYNSVGEFEIDEDDGSKTVIGGGKLAVGSAELDYLLNKSWSVSTFYDAGDAFNDDPQLRTSWGLGARWYSPVGAVRLDIAFPHHNVYGGQEDKDDFRIHLSVGADL